MQPHDNLDRLHISGDHYQLSLLLLDQVGHVVDAVLQHQGCGSSGASATGRLIGGLLLNALSLGLLGLGGVLGEQLEERHGLSAVQGEAELVEGSRHLQAVQQNLLLALDADVTGPLDKATDVTDGLHVASDTQVLRLAGHQLQRNQIPQMKLLPLDAANALLQYSGTK